MQKTDAHPCPPKTHGYGWAWAWAWAPNVWLRCGVALKPSTHLTLSNGFYVLKTYTLLVIPSSNAPFPPDFS